VKSDNGKLDRCGCCKKDSQSIERYNRPGLPSIQYRLNTHSGFFQRLLSRLHLQKTSLAALSTRSQDDPSIAFLDAWALVSDVLTFYQERIANEGFLHTLEERSSALELARSIGYELKPGVAASAYLAFSMEDTPGSPRTAIVPQSLAVKSIPPPGKLPQTFETVEEIETRIDWNLLLPQLKEEQQVEEGATSILIEGLDTMLQPGDALLFLFGYDDRAQQDGSCRFNLRIITEVIHNLEENCTIASWNDELRTDCQEDNSPANLQLFAMRQRPDLECSMEYLFNWEKAEDEEGKRRLKQVLKDKFGIGWIKDAEITKIGNIITASAESESLSLELNDAKTEVTLKINGVETNFIAKEESIELNIYTRSIDYAKCIDLLGTYPKILPDSWIAMTLDNGLYQVKTVSLMTKEIEEKSHITTTSKVTPPPTGSESESMIEASSINKSRVKITSIEPYKSDGLEGFSDLKTSVFAQSEVLTLAEKRRDGAIRGNTIELDRIIYGLTPGKILIASGKFIRALVDDPSKSGTEAKKGDSLQVVKSIKSSDNNNKIGYLLRDGDGLEKVITDEKIRLQPSRTEDEVVSEAVFLLHDDRSSGRTKLTLQEPLEHCYDPATFRIFANIARATHGETIEQVLGSGDGSKPNQSFSLEKPYLTYVSAPTMDGIESTLKVRVDGVRWIESPAIFGLDETSRRYIVRADDDTISTIAFGDGKSGARLPTGQENIIAVYRSGIGPDGEVDAESLTVLQSRPKGIKDVTNPISALGAAAPEELWSARRNAPMTVLTLGRIVSLSDFENFARSFAGIGKAQAVSLSWKGVRLLHITVASSSGRVIDQGSELMKNLVRAIDAMRDPVSRIRERVIVESFIPRTFSLKARIQVDDHYLAADVLSQIEIELKRNFSFENREFGQFVTAAEVLSVIQSADGVVAVDLEQLYRDDEQTKTARSTDSNSAVDKNNASIILQASRASIDINGTTVSAELLLLNPSDISLEENIL
jgi:hypothetical protein